MFKLNPINLVISTLVATGFSSAVFAADVSTEQAEKSKKEAKQDKYIDRIQILGSNDKLRTQGGATTLVSEQALETFEFDDINQVLATVPGVNIRQEDGYGLRPNIGFRGASPERSKKISLMEDGVLISPAPYSAPSAYYFPMVSRMTAVEVFKGPAAIKYGPNTVAGALNLVTRTVPEMQEGAIDLAYGSDQYSKLHAHYGSTQGKFGYLIEGLHTQADGFKQIDFSDSDTGFTKSDLMAKFKYDLSSNGHQHFVELKLAHAEEESDETYLGLTDQDFAENPYRRYASTQHDKMRWDHQTYQLTHYIEFEQLDVITRIYQHDFARDWRKVSSLGKDQPSLLDVLSAPEQFQAEYALLSGQASGDIILGTNDRNYQSRGIQTDLTWLQDFAGLSHKFDIGVRFHQDFINRDHFEQSYQMTAEGQLGAESEKVFTTVNREEVDALSVYLQDTVTFGKLTLTAGVRSELIESRYQNRKDENDWLTKKSQIWLPSLSAFYKLADDYGVFAGIHQGYVPSSPQQDDENVEAEKSVNYEIGFRQNGSGVTSEIVAFYNDYSNLKESCSFSQSSNCDLDSDFNGGNVNVFGLEAQIASKFKLSQTLDMPWSVTYSYVKSEFEQSFNSDYPQWGEITAGDSMPYQPDHTLTLMTGLNATNWQLNLLAKYIGEMQETAGQGQNLSNKVIDSSLVFDLAANYNLYGDHSLYFKADNITDEIEVISRRPNGARPGKPRMFTVGYKFSF